MQSLLATVVQLWLVIGICSAASGLDGQRRVYLGINSRKVAERLRVEVVRQDMGGIEFKWPNSLGLRILQLRVFPTEANAQECFRRWQFSAAVGPSPNPAEAEGIGEEFRWWLGMIDKEKVGGVQFRRRNVCVAFSSAHADVPLNKKRAIYLARLIDHLLRDDREIAPLGRFDPVPAISDPGVPKVLRVRKARLVEVEGKAVSRVRTLPWAYARIEPKFAGLGPRAKVRFWVTSTPELVGNQVAPNGFSIPKLVNVPVGAGAVRVARPSAEDDGRFILQIKVPAERTVCKLTMTAVNDMNVVVTREVEVVLEPQR